MNDLSLPLDKSAEVTEVLKFIDGSIKKTTEQILETGYGFFVLKEACNRENISFGETIQERYRMNKTAGSRWVKIGSKYKELFQYRNQLPTSYSTIYSLLTLPKKAFAEVVEDGCLHPNMTFEEAEQIKSAYKADAKAKKSVKDENGEDGNPFSDENLAKSEKEAFSGGEKEINPLSFTDDNESKDVIEGDFTEVTNKSSKKKKNTLTVFEAIERLEIDLDDAFILAKRSGKYTEKQLIEAIAVLRGEA